MTRHLLLAATLCTALACNPASESTPAPATTASAAPSTSAPAPAPAVAAAAPAGPKAPELAPLTPPAGPSAADNVKIDVDAAMTAKDCKIVEGRLHECAAEREYLGARNNFVAAKAPDHVRTIFNLLGAEEPAVRILVLDADPVHYVSVYLEERADDPTLYEPLLAAALAERDPDVRPRFAAEAAEIPVYREHRRLVPYLGAIGERYSSEQNGTSVIDALAEITECKECDDALLGIAHRNPEVTMRIAAMVALDREGTPAETLCVLALANFDVDDEDDAEKVANVFVREDPSCASHWPAWIDAFEAKAKAGVPPRAWLEAAGDILEDERGKPHVARIRSAAKALLATLPEETEQRYRVESLATES